MIRTYGLTHVALAVTNAERSLQFYQRILGVIEPADVGRALDEIADAGGRILSHGEFCPGEPYAFFADPDGYEVELWHELSTPVDPPASGTLRSPSSLSES